MRGKYYVIFFITVVFFCHSCGLALYNPFREDDETPLDESPPVINSFILTSNSPATSHFITFTLEGSDSGTGISWWLINENAGIPDRDDPGWTTEKPDLYMTSPGYTTKTIYAWAMDTALNISLLTEKSYFNVKIEYTGNNEWDFEKNNPGNDYIKGAAVDYDDNLYAAGLVSNTTDDWHIIKLTPGGTEDTTDWNKTIDWYGGSDSAQGVAVDSGNNVYVAGWLSDGTDFLWGVKKYTATGTEVWSREWDKSSGDDGAQGIAIDSADAIYVTGYITNESGNYDWWIKKYYPDGSEDTDNWNFGFDSGNGDDTIISVALDSLNNVYIAGRTANPGGNLDWLVRKYNQDGVLQWSKDFDYAGKNDKAHSITIDSADNVYIAGYITRSDDDIDWCIKKYDKNGNEETTGWDKYITYGTGDIPWSICTDSANNVYACGRLLYTDNEWTVIQFDSGGNELSRDVIAHTGNDWCRTIVTDSMDYIYGAGVMYRTGYDSDWYIKKYILQ